MNTKVLMVSLLSALMAMVSCSIDDKFDDCEYKAATRQQQNEKTVLVYMAGRNNLSKALEEDLREIKEGSKRLHDNENMLVFVRRNNEQEPWLARIKNGEVIDSVSLSDMGIVSTDGPFYSNIIKKYYTSVEVPLTAIQTSEMEHVAQATRKALQSAKKNIGDGYADMTGMIHYYHTDFSDSFYPEYNTFYDAGDFLRTYAAKEAYQEWNQALGKAIVERHITTYWSTDKPWAMKYSDFTVTKEKMHGVSMFVQQDPETGDHAKHNKDIRQFEWYQSAGLSEIGW